MPPHFGTKYPMAAVLPVQFAEACPESKLCPTFDEVYAAHFDFVWLSLRRLGVPPAALDDATQDVFVVVHRKLGEFEFRSQIKTWLFGVATRVAQRQRRDSGAAPVEYRLEELPDPSGSPHDTAARAQALQIMDQILRSMDHERRAVFIMAELEQLPIVEIAEVLGLKLNTAYSRLRLAREAFNDELKRYRARDEWRQK
jgi:RNA polymerase sigma-70 factor (ECF subfamily)